MVRKSSGPGKSPKNGSEHGVLGGRIGSELLLCTQNHHYQSESSAELPEGASGARMAPRWVPSPLGSYFFVLAVVIGFLGAERGDFRGFPRFRIWAKMSQKQRFLIKLSILKTRARFWAPSDSNLTGSHLWVKKCPRSIYEGFRGARNREASENRSECPGERFRIFIIFLISTQIERARSPRSGGVRRRCWVFLKGLSMKF